MTRTIVASMTTLLACLGPAGRSWAQSNPAGEKVDSSIEAQWNATVREHFAEPELLTRRRVPARPGRIMRLLEDVHLEFKAFERDDEGDVALGFAYDIAKTISAPKDSNGTLDFVADGNVAFDRAQNPNDFLWTSLRARWVGGRSPGAREELLQQPPAASGEKDSEAWRTQLRSLERALEPEFVWDFDLHAGMESNQDFSSREWVFGPALSGRLVSWNPDSKLSRYNVFDFPGAALRWLSGTDEGFRPSGLVYPTIRIGLDMVDAGHDDIRSAVTSDESLLRTRFEAGLSTHVLDVDDETLFLSASWCSHHEIDAPSEVRNADYDASSFFELRMDLPRNFALTYSAGRLPLDGNDDSTFGLGYAVKF